MSGPDHSKNRPGFSRSELLPEVNFCSSVPLTSGLVMALSVDYEDASLPFITCEIQGKCDNFLVDSGSTFSVLSLPYRFLCSLTVEPGCPSFSAVNGSPVNIYGATDVVLTYHGTQYSHRFYVANVVYNLLGFDFLRGNNLVCSRGRSLLCQRRQRLWLANWVWRVRCSLLGCRVRVEGTFEKG